MRFLVRASLALTHILIVLLTSDAAQAKPVQVTKLVQREGGVGVFTVLASPSYLRVEDAHLGLIYVASAPAWEMSLYSPVEKIIHSEPASHWTVHGIAKRGKMWGIDINLRAKEAKVRSIATHGHNCMQYEVPLPDSGLDWQMLDSAMYGKKIRDMRTHFDLVAWQAHWPKEIETALYSIYQLPVADGLPIDAFARWQSGPKLTLKTLSWTQTLVDSTIFDKPSNLHNVTAFEKVLFSDTTKKSSEEFFKDMDKDRPLFKTKD